MRTFFGRCMAGGFWRTPRLAWRIWRASVIGRQGSYKAAWDAIGGHAGLAFRMVDGSTEEAGLRAAGVDVAARLQRGFLIAPEHDVLEIGCGAARIGRELAPLCRMWQGVDVSARMLAHAQRRTRHLSNVRLCTTEPACRIPLPDESFDRIYAHIVFIHLDKEDLFLYLREIRRLLRPWGIAYFDTWNLMNEAGWGRWMDELDHYPDRARRPVHRNQWSTPDELRLYTKHAGLTALHLLDSTFWLQMLATKVPAPASADVDERLEALRGSLVADLDTLHPTGVCTW